MGGGRWAVGRNEGRGCGWKYGKSECKAVPERGIAALNKDLIDTRSLQDTQGDMRACGSMGRCRGQIAHAMSRCYRVSAGFEAEAHYGGLVGPTSLMTSTGPAQLESRLQAVTHTRAVGEHIYTFKADAIHSHYCGI